MNGQFNHFLNNEQEFMLVRVRGMHQNEGKLVLTYIRLLLFLIHRVIGRIPTWE